MSTAKRLAKYLLVYKTRFIEALLCMVMSGILTTVLMYLLKETIDKALTAKNIWILLLIVASIPMLFFIRGIFTYLQNYLMYSIGQKVAADLREQMYSRLHMLSLDYYYKTSQGKIIAYLTNDVNTLQININDVPLILVRDGLTIVFLLIYIFYLHWKFALISLIIFPLASVLLINFAKKMRLSGRKAQNLMARLYKYIQDVINGILVVKSFVQEEREIKRFTSLNRDFYATVMRFQRIEAMSIPIVEFAGSLVLAFLLFYGGKDVIDNVWTTGAFFSFFGAMLSMYHPLRSFAGLNARVQQMLSAAERVFSVIDEKPTICEVEDPEELTGFNESIIYNSVWFCYERDRYVLKNINLKINKGDRVAFVGPSGSGKTTLLLLLLRFFDPTKGEILIDNKNIKYLRLSSLRRKIGIVPQETVLFNDTVRNNICYGNMYADEESVIAAAKLANAHTFISKLPQGYNTIIGERGVSLSVGEQQRIMLARVFLLDQPILIFDEATSALDAESEELIRNAIFGLPRDKTILIIAHRLSTILNADYIIAIENGEIIGIGTHQELMNTNPLYKRFYELQCLL